MLGHVARQALRLGDRSPKVLNNLAWLLAAAPDPGLRSPHEAVELSAMLRQSGFGDVVAYGDLEGAAYDPTAKRLIAVARKPPV